MPRYWKRNGKREPRIIVRDDCYRIRQRRFRHAVNAMVKAIVEFAVQLGVSKIILGRLGA